jgi:hypothetical protein
MFNTYPGVLVPYYDDGNVAIFHGDAFDVMPSLNPAVMVLTDPPYNVVNRASQGLRNLDRGEADSAPVDCTAVVAALARLTSGSAYVRNRASVRTPGSLYRRRHVYPARRLAQNESVADERATGLAVGGRALHLRSATQSDVQSPLRSSRLEGANEATQGSSHR